VRESKPSASPSVTASTTTTTANAPSVLVAAAPELPATTVACNCLNDTTKPPLDRTPCVEELRDDASLEAAECLQRFVDAHEKSLGQPLPADPTPEQALILAAVHAREAKTKPQSAKAPPLKPAPVGTPQFPSPVKP
jgi:hypothetical protein